MGLPRFDGVRVKGADSWKGEHAIANLSHALWSLAPLSVGKTAWGGAILLALLRGRQIDRDLAVSYLEHWLHFGVRPRDWPPNLVARLDGAGSPESELASAMFLFYYHEDRGESEIAGGHLLRAAALCDGSQPVAQAVAIEAAYVVGLHSRNAAKARAWLDECDRRMTEPHTWERAEAAVLLAEGQFHRAIVVAEQGLESSKTSADPGGAKAERDWLQRIINASREALATPPTAVLAAGSTP